MRIPIHAKAAALALCGGIAVPVHAQLVVTDPGNTAQAVEQVVQMVRQLGVMKQQYEQLMQTYQAVAHLPQASLRELGQKLDVDRFRNALPAQGSVLGELLEGSSPGTGPLAAAAASQLERNSVHGPVGTDFHAGELRRNARSVAGAQAVAGELYQSASDRIWALRGIERQLADAPDAKAVADLQARIAAEQTYIQAQQVQAQALAMWQASQERSLEQRRQEERRRQTDSLIEQAKARGG